MGKIKDLAGKAKEKVDFWTEPEDSEDFDKEWDDWKASKDAKKGGYRPPGYRGPGDRTAPPF